MMQRFVVCVAAALPVAAVLAPGARASGGDDWSRFDAELEALLASGPTSVANPPSLHGFVKATWARLPNIPVSPTVHEDQNRFAVDRVQLSIEGSGGHRTSYIVEIEGAGGTFQALDAYGAWDANENIRLVLGRFRSPAVWESQLHDSDLLFLLRSDTGELFYTRDNGAMASGAFGEFHWAVAGQNGLDNVEDHYSLSLRASYDVLGGGVGLRQGAFGGTDEAKLSFGAGFYDEGSQGGGKDGQVVVVDAQFQMGRFAADAMWGKYQDFSNPFFAVRSDSMPWNVSASCVLVEDLLEVGARYQDTDNIFNESDVTLGANYFIHGHAVKAQFNVSHITSDDDALDGTIRLGAGFNVRV